MVKCDYCVKEEDIPFRCNYCGGYFCLEHRLPEFHECTGMHRGIGTERRSREFSSPPGDYNYKRSYARQRRIGNIFGFSDRELRDLGIGLLLISSIPLMWLRQYLSRAPIVVLGAIAIFAAAFLLHELAHKFMAQRLGYWAEFRLDQMGLFITLLSFISPFKIIAPGAVMIGGRLNGDDFGKISFVGPLTNIAQAIFFLLIGFLVPGSYARIFSYVGATVNSSLALFNLIPFGVFDGVKIMRWNMKIWVATTGIALALYLNSSL